MNKFISHHHGRCNLCNVNHSVIMMLGYGQDSNYYCICKDCFAINIQQIIFGYQDYEDGLIDLNKVLFDKGEFHKGEFK